MAARGRRTGDHSHGRALLDAAAGHTERANKKTPSTELAEGVPDLFLISVNLVAGARFERAIFRL